MYVANINCWYYEDYSILRNVYSLIRSVSCVNEIIVGKIQTAELRRQLAIPWSLLT